MPLCLEVLIYLKPVPIPLFFCLYYYSWEVVLTTKWNDLVFFTKPLQATVMLSLNFAESLKAYFMRLCLCALRF